MILIFGVVSSLVVIAVAAGLHGRSWSVPRRLRGGFAGLPVWPSALVRARRRAATGTIDRWAVGGVAVLASLAVVVPRVPSAQAEQDHPSSVQARFAALGSGQRKAYGIRQLHWVPSAGGLPGYEFVLGCLDCAGATYDNAGALTNSTALSRIPTSWILRVPENYHHRLVVQVPPAAFDQTFFRPHIPTLLGDGDAFAMMDHPEPGFDAFPYDQFITPPFRTSDYRRGYEQAGRVLKGLLREVVGPSEGSYLLSVSRGALVGGGLLAGSETSPFDGNVLLAAGGGWPTELKAVIKSLRGDGLIPLTHLPNTYWGVSDLPDSMIGLADPEYRAKVLAGTANALEYDVTKRPAEIQKAWRALAYGGHLRAPTIVIQGLHDIQEWPGGTVHWAQDVVAADAQDNLRLFFFKNMGHGPASIPPGPTNAMWVDAVRALDQWNTDGAEPGPLVHVPTGETQSSCTAQGFGSDPRACFDAVFGSGY